MEQPPSNGSPGSTPKRKFAPDLVESTSRTFSVRSTPKKSESPKPTGRFRPQLVETSSEHRRGGSKENKENKDPIPPSPSKRFTPQLIETAKRSFRQNNSPFPTEQGKIGINNSPSMRSQSLGPDFESRYSYNSLLRRQAGKRQSFQIPNLPAIPSNSSEDSALSRTSSLSTSPTSFSHDPAHRRHSQFPYPEPYTDSIPEEMYNLHSRLVSEKLKAQALAAFPNEQVYQPVSHFAIDQEEGDSIGDEESIETAFRQFSIDLSRFRRESTADLAWELEEMRRHKEESESRARERRFAAKPSPFSAAALAAKYREEWEMAEGGGYDIIGGWQRGVNLEPMREAASPPMLGDDIVFTKCLSPQSTICPLDQTEATKKEDVPPNDSEPSLWVADHDMPGYGDAGLWKGTCHKDCEIHNSNPKVLDTGLITPGVYATDIPCGRSAQQTCQTDYINFRPHTPPPEQSHLLQVRSAYTDPTLEREIKLEFDDQFVTQIYNYLSLGYPCLARDFDPELSKITGVPILELRKDDLNANTRGHLDAPEGPGSAVSGRKPTRWRALKSYIHEWARQQSRSSGPGAVVDSWGVPERRGSWAV
ncbi:hypothetical protein FQN57_005795 [Myotisia sp. PD_48]|nr:hypothetical protein FQN57_005795 [Myotisia sp. PD_48]